MSSQDYQRIEQAIRYLQQHIQQQPSLAEVARHTGLSPYHFQRLFSRWAGVSPKRFLQYLTLGEAKQLLRESKPLLDTSYALGLSSPGRLHDLFVTVEGVTPGEFKSWGAGLQIGYGFHDTPYGKCLIARTERGICNLGFVEESRQERALEQLQHDWSAAHLQEQSETTGRLVEQIFRQPAAMTQAPLRLLLRGTNFQLKVWQALLQIPAGSLVSYSGLAQRLGTPKATRAVAGAIGRNPIGYLIPCHRVLRSTGELGGYRWGNSRKQAILARELAQRDRPTEP